MSTAGLRATLSGAQAARLRIAIYALLIAAFILLRVFRVQAAAPALSILTIAAILVSLPALSRIARLLSLIFLASGTAMLMATGVTLSGYVGAYGQMAHLVALFCLVPLLALPVRLGGYGEAISTVLRGRLANVSRLNMLVTLLAYACGSFMTMAAIPIMFTSMKPVVDTTPLQDRLRFMASSVTANHLLSMLWSPVSGVLAAILTGLRVGWFEIIGIMLPLSVLALLANWLLFQLMEPGSTQALPPAAGLPGGQQLTQARQRLLQLAGVILLLVAVMVGLEQWLRLGLVTVVVLATIPFTLAWSIAIGRGRPFVSAALTDLGLRLPRMAEIFAIFLCGGFFASALNMSGYVHQANEGLLALRQVLGAGPFLMALPFATLAASLLGMHPLVAIAVLAESLQPDVLGIPAPQLAIVLTGSALLTYMMGPFSGTLAMVSSITNVSTWRLARWNLPFALAYTACLLLAIGFMQLAGTGAR
ncbi:MAG: hypothetical protein JWP36_1370 [Paucimonas sp.]|nr:hypothetical protein [Paucimonas sp.]